MKLRKVLGLFSALCLGALPLAAQETNNVEQLKKQLQELKENLQKIQQQQREQIEALQKQIEALTIAAEHDSDLCGSDIIEAINRVDSGDGLAILTDMFGNTPSNLAISCMSRPKVDVLAGINLPCWSGPPFSVAPPLDREEGLIGPFQAMRGRALFR